MYIGDACECYENYEDSGSISFGTRTFIRKAILYNNAVLNPANTAMLPIEIPLQRDLNVKTHLNVYNKFGGPG